LTGPHTPWLPTEKFQGKAKAGEYGDFVTMVDDAVAQVLAALEESGMANDALVIDISGNGAHWLPEETAQWEHHANHFLHGQNACIWDGGHRIPFLARWPGRTQSGTTCDETVCLTGKKLLGPIREATVHHSIHAHFSIRKGEWKLNIGRGSGGFSEPIEYKPRPGEPEGELFNLAQDPSETRNLYRERPRNRQQHEGASGEIPGAGLQPADELS
jgi:arylsulfatase A